ncbi:MAG: hypothetical protein ACRYGP_33080 [Janthinobacterium lividum]
MQFFDHLLGDDPWSENKVVFAETLSIPPSLDKEPAKEAVELLAHVMLDKTISSALFKDPLALQSDVFGQEAGADHRKLAPPVRTPERRPSATVERRGVVFASVTAATMSIGRAREV